MALVLWFLIKRSIHHLEYHKNIIRSLEFDWQKFEKDILNLWVLWNVVFFLVEAYLIICSSATSGNECHIWEVWIISARSRNIHVRGFFLILFLLQESYFLVFLLIGKPMLIRHHLHRFHSLCVQMPTSPQKGKRIFSVQAVHWKWEIWTVFFV